MSGKEREGRGSRGRGGTGRAGGRGTRREAEEWSGWGEKTDKTEVISVKTSVTKNYEEEWSTQDRFSHEYDFNTKRSTNNAPFDRRDRRETDREPRSRPGREEKHSFDYKFDYSRSEPTTETQPRGKGNDRDDEDRSRKGNSSWNRGPEWENSKGGKNGTRRESKGGKASTHITKKEAPALPAGVCLIPNVIDTVTEQTCVETLDEGFWWPHDTVKGRASQYFGYQYDEDQKKAFEIEHTVPEYLRQEVVAQLKEVKRGGVQFPLGIEPDQVLAVEHDWVAESGDVSLAPLVVPGCTTFMPSMAIVCLGSPCSLKMTNDAGKEVTVDFQRRSALILRDDAIDTVTGLCKEFAQEMDRSVFLVFRALKEAIAGPKEGVWAGPNRLAIAPWSTEKLQRHYEMMSEMKRRSQHYTEVKKGRKERQENLRKRMEEEEELERMQLEQREREPERMHHQQIDLCGAVPPTAEPPTTVPKHEDSNDKALLHLPPPSFATGGDQHHPPQQHHPEPIEPRYAPGHGPPGGPPPPTAQGPATTLHDAPFSSNLGNIAHRPPLERAPERFEHHHNAPQSNYHTNTPPPSLHPAPGHDRAVRNDPAPPLHDRMDDGHHMQERMPDRMQDRMVRDQPDARMVRGDHMQTGQDRMMGREQGHPGQERMLPRGGDPQGERMVAPPQQQPPQQPQFEQYGSIHPQGGVKLQQAGSNEFQSRMQPPQQTQHHQQGMGWFCLEGVACVFFWFLA